MSFNDASSGCSADRPEKVSGRRLLTMCAVSLAAGIAVTQWLDHRGSVSYAGSIQSRTTVVAAERATRISDMQLQIGQRIVPGDKLLTMADDILAAQISDKKRQLVEMEADLNRVKATAEVELEWRQRELNGEIFQTQLKMSSVSQELTSKQVEQLAWQDYIKELRHDPKGPQIAQALLPVKSIVMDSPFPNDAKQLQAMVKEDAAAAAAEALATQVALCEEQLIRLRKLEKELPTKIRVSTGVDLVEARLTRGREELSLLEKQQESLVISSSVHGVIGTIRHQSGDVVRPGEVLVELFDDDRRHVVAHFPSTVVTKLHTGSKVSLTFPGKQSRIGLVSSIPPHAVPAERQVLFVDSQVALTIEPAGKLWPKMPIGTGVQVKVVD